MQQPIQSSHLSLSCEATKCLRAGGLLVLAILVGCGSASDKVPTAPVTGKVMYDGLPVMGGTVMFTPVAGGPPATGELKTDGTYVMKTYEEGDGAIPGEHKVIIVALDMGSGLPEDPASEPISLIPDKYGRDSTSGLTATVVPGENVINFTLDEPKDEETDK